MAYLLNESIKAFLLEKFDKYRHELKSEFFERLRADRETERFGFDGQMSDVNGNLLWIMMREFKPKTVLEFSCSRGYTTLIMLEAMKQNNVGHLFGLEPGYDAKDKEEKLNNLRKNLEPYKNYCTIWENELNILPEIFKVQNMFDLIFVDTLHNAKAANYYTNEVNIWEHLNPDGWLQLHDIWKDGGKESLHVLNWIPTLNSEYWFPIFQYTDPLRLNSFGIRSKSDFRYPIERAVWVKKKPLDAILPPQKITLPIPQKEELVKKSTEVVKKEVMVKKEKKQKKKDSSDELRQGISKKKRST